MIIYGKNTVFSALKNVKVKRVWIKKGVNLPEDFRKEISKIKDVREVPAKVLEKICGSEEHQGICAEIEFPTRPKGTFHISEGEFAVFLDKVQDVQNIGNIIRTSYFFSAKYVLLSDEDTPSITPAMCKSSAGAIFYGKILYIKKKDIFSSGVEIYALERGGEDIRNSQPKTPFILVVGSEGSGVSRDILKNAKVFEIPGKKNFINSLNVSSALAVGLWEILRKSLLFFFIFLFFPLKLFSEKIQKIEIEGVKRVSREFVENAISLREGDEFDKVRLRKDLERIFSLGVFKDVSAEFSQGVLKINVKENPIIISVKVDGRKELDEEKLKDAIFIKEGRFLKASDLFEQVKKIKDIYKEEGFLFADVQAKVEEIEDRVKVRIIINEGDVFRVRGIFISGAKKEKDHRGYFLSRESGFFSTLGGDDKVNFQKVSLDRENLRESYLDKGYIDVSVEKPFILFSPQNAKAYLLFKVEEGARYKIKSLDVSGDLLFDKNDIIENMKTKTGDFFSKKLILEDINFISSLYQDIGFAESYVDPIISKKLISKDEGEVSLDFKISRGRIFYIRNFSFLGNTRTRDRIIRNQISLFEGEAFSRTYLIKSRYDLLSTGFFEDVKIDTRKVSPNQVDIDIEVKEGKTGAVSVGAGISPTLGSIYGVFQGNFLNFLGFGQKVNFFFSIGGGIFFFNLNFEDRQFLDRDFIFISNAYNYSINYLSFIKNIIGANVGFGRFLLEKTRFTITPGINYYNKILAFDYSGTVGGYSIFPPGVKEGMQSRYVELKLTQDTRDNIFFPSKGRYISLWSQIGGVFGGDIYYFKSGVDFNYYFPVFQIGVWKIVFSPSFRLGFGTGTAGVSTLPYPERFFVGGIDTIRGFAYYSLGPNQKVKFRDVVAEIKRGGNKLFVSNFELIFPIIPQANLFGVLFSDAGSVFPEEEFINPKDFRLSIGFGIRWITPFAPIRIEFGFPLIKKPEDRIQNFDFLLGTFTSFY